MQKMKSMLVACVGLLCLQANAEQSLSGTQTQAHPAGREELLKSKKLSPRERAELAKAAAAEQGGESAAQFLAGNKAKPSVVTLASGVQYRVLKAGNGKKAGDKSSLRCRYQGALTDGTTFDKSEDKSPLVIRVAGLVPGLKEAVKLMPAGSKWEIVVPPALGYGARGNRSVGPNAVLVYTMEVVAVE